ncbi:MAG: YczE/YyaS/YitT family protein [Lachnospiraceae bacterium]
MNTTRIHIRVIIYCVGLLLMAFGVTFSIRSGLGVSPVNSIPYVLSLITSIDQGLLTTIIFCTYIVIQIIILRKEFKKINFLQIFFSGLFGYFVSFSNHLWRMLPEPQNYLLQLVFLGSSIVMVALGLMLYLIADIVPQPAEGLVMAIQKKTKIPFARLKTTFDTIVVVIAALISIMILRELDGIREGTLLSAILIGKLLGVLNHKWGEKIKNIIEGIDGKEENIA